MIGLAFLLTAQAVAASPSPPAPPPAAVAPDAVRLALGREIAALLNSEAILKIQFDKAFADTIPKAFMADPDIAAMEQEYPGIVAYILAQSRPTMEHLSESRGPELIGRLAAAYAGALDEAELRQALAFYRSPTGVWLIDRVAHGIDLGNIMGAYIRDGDKQITGNDFRGAMMGAIPALAADMTPQRTNDILAFLASPAGRKIRVLNPLLLETAAKWTNEPDPAADKEMETVIKKAVRDYIARAKRKPSGASSI